MSEQKLDTQQTTHNTQLQKINQCSQSDRRSKYCWSASVKYRKMVETTLRYPNKKVVNDDILTESPLAPVRPSVRI